MYKAIFVWLLIIVAIAGAENVVVRYYEESTYIEIQLDDKEYSFLDTAIVMHDDENFIYILPVERKNRKVFFNLSGNYGIKNISYIVNDTRKRIISGIDHEIDMTREGVFDAEHALGNLLDRIKIRLDNRIVQGDIQIRKIRSYTSDEFSADLTVIVDDIEYALENQKLDALTDFIILKKSTELEAGTKRTVSEPAILSPGSSSALNEPIQIRFMVPGWFNANSAKALLFIDQGYIVHDLYDYERDKVFESSFFSLLDPGDYRILAVAYDRNGKNITREHEFHVGKIEENVSEREYVTDTIILSHGHSEQIKIAELELPHDINNQVMSRQSTTKGIDARLPSVNVLDVTDSIEQIKFHNIHFNGSIELGAEDIVVPGYIKAYAIDPTGIDFSNATVTVTATGTELYKCANWDYSNQACMGRWVLFMDNLVPGQQYSFILIPDDPGFAEKLTILNVQSYPTVGGYWNVSFQTEGSADLYIRTLNGTTWSNEVGEDLWFQSLMCGNATVGGTWLNDTLFFQNYSCNETSQEVSRVLSAGKHLIEFRFGSQVGYARNLADLLRMEWGEVSSVNETWETVSLSLEYNNPVVVASVQYASTVEPVVTRIRNVGISSFELKLQNPNSTTDAPVTARDVFYLVVEEGQWSLRDGTNIEAWSFSSADTDEDNDWSPVQRTYQNSYTNPVVLGQVMTYNDANWSVFWDSDGTQAGAPDSANLYMSKHVAEDPVIARLNETLGYIVIQEGHGTINTTEYDAVVSTESIDGITNAPPYNGGFNSSFSSTPEIAVISSAGMTGGNGGWPIIYGTTPFSTTGLDLAIDEDQVNDDERGHISEKVAMFTFESAGSFVYNDAPTIDNAVLNESVIEIAKPVTLNVSVGDNQGNDSVLSVKATFEYPNGTKQNVSLFAVATGWIYNWTDTLNAGRYNVTDIYSSDDYTTNHISYTSIFFIAQDTIPPVFTYISNISINNETTLSVDYDAYDISGISAWAVNDSDFTIDNNGLLENATKLYVDEYWLKISVNDTYSNIAWKKVLINITTEPDVTPPWFDPIINQTAEYGYGFTYDIDAYDDSGIIDSFAVNDTNFTIDSDGVLEIYSQPDLSVYYLNISVNDTTGNLNWTLMKVTVQDTTPPWFSPALSNQTIEFGSAFYYDIDAEDNFAIDYFNVNDSNFYMNMTTGELSNATGLARRAYYLNISINDAQGLLTYGLARVTVQDTTPPGTVTGLDETLTKFCWILWNWTNPTDSDFSHVEVWRNGTFITNTSNEYINLSDLWHDTHYEIGIRAADIYGNVNTTWVNDTYITPYSEPATIILDSPENASVNPATHRSLSLNAFDDLCPWFCISVYGDDDTPGTEDLLYYNCSFLNNTYLEYNYSAPVLEPDADTELLWHFNNQSDYGESDSYVSDFANSHDLSCSTNCPDYQENIGKFAGAFDYAGSDCWVLDEPFFHDLFAVKSYQVWINPDALSGIQTILEEGGATNGIAIRLNGATLEYATQDNQVMNTITTPYPNDGGWHTVIAQFDSNNMTLYLDGVLVNTTTTTYASVRAHTDNGGIGCTTNQDAFDATVSNYYSGLIDEIRARNVVLTPDEALAASTLEYGKRYYWYASGMDKFESNTSETFNFLVQNGTVNWTQDDAYIGFGLREEGNISGIVHLQSIGPGPNTVVACDTGNCSLILDNFTDSTGLEDEIVDVNFTCINQSKGLLWAIFNVTSGQASIPDQVNVSCEFLPNVFVVWNVTGLDIGNTTNFKGNISSTISIISGQANSEVNVSCTGNCSRISQNWTNGTSMVDAQEIDVTFECDDSVPGSISADYTLISKEDPVPSIITAACQVFDPAPATVTGLSYTAIGYDWILWNWTNPPDPDFDHVELWLEGANTANTSLEFYNFSGLAPNTSYELGIRTVDDSGNINTTLVTDEAWTLENDLPDIILKWPPDEWQYHLDNYDIVLNTTVLDEQSMCIDIFGGENPSSRNLLYSECDVENNTDIIYNWSAPAREDTSDIYCLYHFDNRSEFGESDTLANDFGGNCNDAICSGGTCPTFNMSGGKFAGAYYYDGADEFDLGATSVFDDAFTYKMIEVWFRAEAISGSTFRVIYEEGGNTHGLNMYIYDDKVFAGYWVFGSGMWHNFTTTAGEWHYLAMIFNGNNNLTVVYDDQVKSAPIAVTMPDHTGDNTIGRSGGCIYHDSSTGSGNGFTGYLDEFAVYWESTLPVSEAIEHFRLGEGKYYWYANATDFWDTSESVERSFNISDIESYQVY